MNTGLKTLAAVALCLGLLLSTAFAQTDGLAKLEATILDYTGSSSTKHWTVIWITTADGTFIKSLRKQGPAWTTTHWDSHCSVWNTARGGSASGSQVLDGYSSATAQDYTGTNSPVILTWNCRDASNILMPDGSYKFWIQYAEDAGQGPYTTSGLLWTKGGSGSTNNYANQGVNFANMKVTWSPTTPPAPAAPPNFTGLQIEGSNLVLSGTGPTNGIYSVLVATTATTLAAQWTAIATNTFDSAGKFRFTNAISSAAVARFYRLQVQ